MNPDTTLGTTGPRCDVPKPAYIAGMVFSLSFTFLSTWLVNNTAYAGFNDFFPAARDVATTFGALVAAASALVAMRRPSLFCSVGFLAASLGCLVVGSILMFCGIACASPFLASLGSCVRTLCFCGTIYAALALSRMPTSVLVSSTATAYLLKYVWMAILTPLPREVLSVALVVLPFVSVIILYRLARPMLALLLEVESPADLAITNPLSFLPFTHRLFAVILMFSAATGFAITYGSSDSVPMPFIYSCVLVAVVMLPACLGCLTSLDKFFGISYAFVLAGLLFIPGVIGSARFSNQLANTFLQAGCDVFDLVFWVMAASIASRNLAAAIPVAMTCRFASALGVELGAVTGHVLNYLDVVDPAVVPLLVAGVVFVFAVYNFDTARRFSFDRTLLGVEPVVTAHPAVSNAGSGYGSSSPAGTGWTAVPGSASGGWISAEALGTIADVRVGSPEPAATPDAVILAGSGVSVPMVEPLGFPSVDEACVAIASANGLTARESQVLALLARGRNVAYIQEDLVLSRNTVKSYVASVYSKLGVHSHQQLIDLVEGWG